jgi:hypothetical protein
MKRTNYRQKSSFRLAIVLFLVFFLFSVSATAFHHHKDGFFHNDCPLCITGNLFYMSYQNCSFDNVSLTVADIDLPHEPIIIGSVYVTHVSLRGPPA